MIPTEQLERIAERAAAWLELAPPLPPRLIMETELAVQQALDYCQREDVPPAMEIILGQIVANTYKAGDAIYGGTTDPINHISDITMGDLRVGLGGQSSGSRSQSMEATAISNYRVQLNRFRKARGARGNDPVT